MRTGLILSAMHGLVSFFGETPHLDIAVLDEGKSVVINSASFGAEIYNWDHGEEHNMGSTEWSVIDFESESEPVINHCYWSSSLEYEALVNGFVSCVVEMAVLKSCWPG